MSVHIETPYSEFRPSISGSLKPPFFIVKPFRKSKESLLFDRINYYANDSVN